MNPHKLFGGKTLLLISIAALGYFVDVYDLILFSVVRTASLTALGVAQADLLPIGLSLLNYQVAGMVLGGIIWGILGDKKGRVSVLLGSIALYSLANLANAFVTSVPQYELLRFLAGVGLAGELGAGVTLVSETVPTRLRGIATMILAGFGFLGGVVAALVGMNFPWQTAFIIGGVAGLLLLLLRASLFESGLYKKMQGSEVSRGNIFMIFTNKKRLKDYVLAILAGAPVYFVVGIIVTAAPEIGKAQGVSPLPIAAISVIVMYTGALVGDLLSSSFSQVVQSRRKALLVFNAIGLIGTFIFVLWPTTSLILFYAKTGLLALSVGGWAVLNTSAAEHFGTNLRATVATTVPNFVRGTLIPITMMFTFFKGGYGLPNALLITGTIVCAVAIFASYLQTESFHQEMDYVEG